MAENNWPRDDELKKMRSYGDETLERPQALNPPQAVEQRAAAGGVTVISEPNLAARGVGGTDRCGPYIRRPIDVAHPEVTLISW